MHCELWIFVFKSTIVKNPQIFRNKNLATVMSLFLLNRAYNHYQNIFYVCNKGNIASIRLAKKCGFESSEYWY